MFDFTMLPGNSEKRLSFAALGYQELAVFAIETWTELKAFHSTSFQFRSNYLLITLECLKNDVKRWIESFSLCFTTRGIQI